MKCLYNPIQLPTQKNSNSADVQCWNFEKSLELEKLPNFLIYEIDWNRKHFTPIRFLSKTSESHQLLERPLYGDNKSMTTIQCISQKLLLRLEVETFIYNTHHRMDLSHPYDFTLRLHNKKYCLYMWLNRRKNCEIV